MLRVSQIETYYGGVQALGGISLTVKEGGMVTLIGANGAGKSTLLKTILGIVRASSGEIYFEGARIDQAYPHEIVKMGIVQCPEGRRVWPNMTVLENLEMGAYVRPKGKEVNEDLRDIFVYFPILSERRAQKAGSLSGGEQQMLAIGRALMGKPKLLLLDEPSLGLAPIIVERTAQIIKGIHQRGTTILLVEQNAFLALHMADWGYVLEVGKIVLEGRAEELLENEVVRKAYLGI